MVSELGEMRDLLTASARAVLSERQLHVLEPEQEELTNSSIDPSIQFLGLEWEAIFGKCFNLGINIRIYRQRLGSGHVDTLTLALVLRDLQRVARQVQLHGAAVSCARLRPAGLLGPVGQQVSRSSNNINKVAGPVRYRKTKTEGLAEKINKAELGSKRKSSFIDSLSNLFKNSKI